MRTRILLERAPHARDSRIVVASVQDVELALKRNAALRAERQSHDCARLVASIPNIVLVRWANESGLRPFTREFNEFVWKKLQDPDWKHLRTDR